jgi:hypothetical protein
MKPLVYLVLLAGLLFAGCSKQQGTSQTTNTPSTSSGNPLTAPADYGHALIQAKKLAEKTVDTASIGQAIKMFEASESRLPKTLDELVPGYLPQKPTPPAGMKFDYNPTTGQIKVVPK